MKFLDAYKKVLDYFFDIFDKWLNGWIERNF